MRYVITTWYESPDGTKYMESAPDFVQGDPKKHVSAARKVMSITRPDFDIIPANATPKVLCEPYGFDPSKKELNHEKELKHENQQNHPQHG